MEQDLFQEHGIDPSQDLQQSNPMEMGQQEAISPQQEVAPQDNSADSMDLFAAHGIEAPQAPIDKMEAVRNKLLENILRPAARTVRTGLSGLASIADPINMALQLPLASEQTKQLFDKATGGFAAPRNTAEQLVDSAGELFTGGGAIGKGAILAAKGGGKIAQAAGRMLGVETGQQTASLAGASTAMPVAQAGTQQGLDVLNVAPDSKLRDVANVGVGLVSGVAGGIGGAKAANIPVSLKNWRIKSTLPEAQTNLLGRAKVANQTIKDLETKGISPQEIDFELKGDGGIGLDPIDVSKSNLSNIQDLAQIAASRKILQNSFDIREQRIIKEQNNILRGVTPDENALPQLTQEYLNSLKDKMQKNAKPLYDRAFSVVEQPATTEILPLPKKQELLQQAKGGNKISDEGMDAIFNQYKEARKTINQAKPKSLTQFIKENGGIYDAGGDLKSMGLNEKVGFLRKDPYFTRTTAEGKQQIRVMPDDVAQRAWESGYFPEAQERPTVNNLLDALNEERVGNLKYSEKDANIVQAREQAKYAIDQMENYGIDIEKYKQAKGMKEELKSPSEIIPLNSKFINSEGDEIVLQNVLSRPDIKQALVKSRQAAINAEGTSASKFFRKATNDMSDNHPVVLHNLQSYLRRNSGNLDKLIIDADEASLMAKRSDILQFLDDNLVGYKDARNTYSADLEELMKAQKGTKGIIANLQSDKGADAMNKLYRLSPTEISKVKSQLIAISPEKYSSAVKSFVDQKISTLRENQTLASLVKNPQEAAKLKAMFPSAKTYDGFSKALTYIEKTKPVQDILKRALDQDIKSAPLTESIAQGESMLGKGIKAVPRAAGRMFIDPLSNKISSQIMLQEGITGRSVKSVDIKQAETMANYAFTDEGRQLFQQLAKTTKKTDVDNLMTQIYLQSGFLTTLTNSKGGSGDLSLISDANAKELNMSEDEIRSQLSSQREKEPVLMDGINIDEESKKIKQRFYRD
tara:strand:- start:1095 stop:4028 length:2934 start_codon:yes stop_codon:yes gene_type:complete